MLLPNLLVFIDLWSLQSNYRREGRAIIPRGDSKRPRPPTVSVDYAQEKELGRRVR